MAEKAVSDADIADGWVDAHCKCGAPASHVGEWCPERGDTSGVLTPEQQAAYEVAHAQDVADTQAALVAAQATLAAMKVKK